MPEDNNYRNDQKLEIELVKKDINNISKLVEKIDTTIDKVQQVAQDLSRIVYLQEQKFSAQDRMNKNIDDNLDQQKKSHSEQIADIHTKIDKFEAATSNDLQKIRDELNKINAGLGKRITDIDTWRYMMMGAIALGVFIISKILDLGKFFK